MEFTNDQEKAYELALSGENLFITGGAGTGKTFLLQEIIKAFAGRKKMIVCAPTGTAALKCGGVTIHRAFGFRAGPCITKDMELQTRCPQHIRRADVIIVDEISMCRLDMFDAVAASIQKAEKEEGKHIQVIVCGDFFQLPPVINTASGDDVILNRYYGKFIERGYAFLGENWTRMHFRPAILTEIVRQKDTGFAGELNKARFGDSSSLSYFVENSAKEEIDNAIILCGTNDTAREINERKIRELQGQEIIFDAAIKGTVNNSDMAVDQRIRLKKGTRVMITINDAGGKYVNGSMGVITRISAGNAVRVLLDSGKEVTIGKNVWDIKRYTMRGKRIVQETIGTYTQLPLKPAYAVTIHKSQGATFDKMNLIPRCWDPGQLYVALSRVRDISGLYIDGALEPSILKVDSDVLSFYESIAKEEPYVPVNPIDPSFFEEEPKEELAGVSMTTEVPIEILDDVNAAIKTWKMNPKEAVVVAMPRDVMEQITKKKKGSRKRTEPLGPELPFV